MISFAVALSLSLAQAGPGKNGNYDVGPWDTDSDGVFRPRLPLAAGDVTCSPQRLSPGETLTIRFHRKHAGAAVIVDPSGEAYWVADNDDVPRADPSVVQDGRLAGLSTVTFSVNGLKGYIDYERPRRRVFRKPGVYMFEVSDGLEADEPTLDGWCKVLFTPAPRRTVGGAAGLKPAVAP